MIAFSVAVFQAVAEVLRLFQQVVSSTPHDNLSDGDRETLKKFRPAIRETCTKANFTGSVASIDRILLHVNAANFTYGEANRLFDELRGRLLDEQQQPTFLAIVDARHQDYFREEAIFGGNVAERFPSAAYDIAHAGKCLALDEYTGCVFHLMRAAEYALRAFAATFKVKVTDASTWSAILRDIKNAIEAKSKAWKKRNGNEEFFMGLWSSADAIRAGVRNPTMHLRGKYDDKEAQHIFELTKGFMERAAKRLRDAKR